MATKHKSAKAEPNVKSLRRLIKILKAEGIVSVELLDSKKAVSKKFVADNDIIVDAPNKGCAWKRTQYGSLRCGEDGCDYCATMRYRNAKGELHLACVCWS